MTDEQTGDDTLSTAFVMLFTIFKEGNMNVLGVIVLGVVMFLFLMAIAQIDF